MSTKYRSLEELEALDFIDTCIQNSSFLSNDMQFKNYENQFLCCFIH
jgi:hypothetical protein